MTYGSITYQECSVLSLSLFLFLHPPLPGLPSGSKGLTVDSESLPNGPRLSVPVNSETLPAGSDTHTGGSKALPAGSEALPAGSEALSASSAALCLS